MHLNDYQNEAMRTAIYPIDRGLDYAVFGLAGEAGEVAGAYSKVIRDDSGIVNDVTKENLLKECGDVLWFVAAVARELGTTLDVIAHKNLDKLASRKQRGVLQGSGDNR